MSAENRPIFIDQARVIIIDESFGVLITKQGKMMNEAIFLDHTIKNALDPKIDFATGNLEDSKDSEGWTIPGLLTRRRELFAKLTLPKNKKERDETLEGYKELLIKNKRPFWNVEYRSEKAA